MVKTTARIALFHTKFRLKMVKEIFKIKFKTHIAVPQNKEHVYLFNNVRKKCLGLSDSMNWPVHINVAYCNHIIISSV